MDDAAGVLLGADTSPGANAPPPSKGDFYRCCGSLDTRGMAHCNKTLLNAKIPYQTSKTGKKKSPFEGGGAKRRGMYAYGPATPTPWTKPSGLYFFSGSPKICAQPGDAIYSRLVRRSEWAGDSPPLPMTVDYGGDGKLRTRTTASETRTYRYDRGWNAVNEEVSGATAVSNIFEPGAQVGAILAQTFGTLASGMPVYAYHDHLATVRQWRYPNKNLARANEYDPYGNFYSYSGYMPMPRIYALHEFDLALQQYRAPYRNYSPGMARWTTLDPAGMVDGPNRYAYVGGRPVILLDVFGLESRECPDCLPLNVIVHENCTYALATGVACAIASGYCAKCLFACAFAPLTCTVCLPICLGAAGVCAMWKVEQRRCKRSLGELRACKQKRKQNCCDQ